LENKTNLLTILGVGIVVVLVLIFANFNIEVTVNGKGATKDSITADAAVFSNLVGKSAPDFTLENYNGEKVTLSSLKGKNVILFFNEGLMCYPSCWNQIVAFGKESNLAKKAVILNITVDPKNDWKQAINKMPELSQSTVLFDSNRQVSVAYGVLRLGSSMHKGQFPGHSYIIIDKEGIVKFVKDDVQMAVRNQEIAQELDKL